MSRPLSGQVDVDSLDPTGASDSLATGTLLLGDCLQRLAELGSTATAPFSLIYVDPPFNTGFTHRARQGSGWRVRGVSSYRDTWGGLQGFLDMLAPRLVAAWRLLAPGGSLWLHLDHRAVHDAKVLACEALEGACFQGEVIWVPGNGARRRAAPPVTHQTLLVLSRGEKMRWNPRDPSLREPHAEGSLRSHFRQVDAEGRRYRERQVAGRTYRYYEDEGRMLGSVWTDCPAMAANTPLSKETTGYPTQKPLKLLRRIVAATTEPGDRVLDPMCGSGTTLLAAQQLGRQWLGIDLNPEALQLAAERLKSP